MNHEQAMKQAIALAEKGVGKVSPNPLVGAVIVKDGRVIGQGYHQQYGGPHAERNALADCKEQMKDAELYVTLEPCCHQGKTPPCTEAIIASGIKTVYVGSPDPNPLVYEKGIELLRANGVKVVTGVLQEECERLNEVYFHFVRTQRPFVVMKYAMTMDGKIATAGGESRWISGQEAREKVHDSRNRYCAIMAGSGTVLADDPMLNCRKEDGRNPVRVICDTRLRTPLSSCVVQSADAIPTILATDSVDQEKLNTYRSCGVEILQIPSKGDSIDLSRLMELLGQRGIDSILLEGGSTLNDAALREGIVNKVQVFIAPKLFGGTEAKTPIGGKGIVRIVDGIQLVNQRISMLGEDILIESEVKKHCSQES